MLSTLLGFAILNEPELVFNSEQELVAIVGVAEVNDRLRGRMSHVYLVVVVPPEASAMRTISVLFLRDLRQTRLIHFMGCLIVLDSCS